MNIIGNIDPENIASKDYWKNPVSEAIRTDTIDGMLTGKSDSNKEI